MDMRYTEAVPCSHSNTEYELFLNKVLPFWEIKMSIIVTDISLIMGDMP